MKNVITYYNQVKHFEMSVISVSYTKNPDV